MVCLFWLDFIVGILFWKCFLRDMWIYLVSFYCLCRLVWRFVILSVYFILFCVVILIFVPSYSMVETSYNMAFGIIGLLIMSVFDGGSRMWLICPTPSINCLTYYVRFLTSFVVFIGGWLGYEIARFIFGDRLFSICFIVISPAGTTVGALYHKL